MLPALSPSTADIELDTIYVLLERAAHRWMTLQRSVSRIRRDLVREAHRWAQEAQSLSVDRERTQMLRGRAWTVAESARLASFDRLIPSQLEHLQVFAMAWSHIFSEGLSTISPTQLNLAVDVFSALDSDMADAWELAQENPLLRKLVIQEVLVRGTRLLIETLNAMEVVRGEGPSIPGGVVIG